MELSSELISQFVKSTKDTETKSSEATAYGTIVIDGKTYVQLDGSDQLTPVATTTAVQDGERVTVLIKNHTATVTGNISSPSARTDDVKEVGKQITELDIVMAYRVNTNDINAVNGYIDNLIGITGKYEELSATTAEFETLKAEFAAIEHLSATDMEALNAKFDNLTAEAIDAGILSADDITALEAEIGSLKAYTADFTYVSAESLEAVKAHVEDLEVEKLSAKDAELKYATIENLEATNGVVEDLEVKKLSAEDAALEYAVIADLEATVADIETMKVEYATVDFANIGEAAFKKIFSGSGLIENLVVSEGSIAGELVGVTIKGDLIEGNTVKADKLVVKGSDGIYYKLNVEAGTFAEGEAIPEDSLHGSVIAAKSVTAEKVNVTDLVAFGATIGGFNISDNAIYSGVKASIDNTIRGVYIDNDGQISLGDDEYYLKYYHSISYEAKDEDEYDADEKYFDKCYLWDVEDQGITYTFVDAAGFKGMAVYSFTGAVDGNLIYCYVNSEDVGEIFVWGYLTRHEDGDSISYELKDESEYNADEYYLGTRIYLDDIERYGMQLALVEGETFNGTDIYSFVGMDTGETIYCYANHNLIINGYLNRREGYKLAISADSILFGGDSKTSMSDVKALTEHVKIGAIEDEETGDVKPCIELAEGDSDFKQVITNVKTMFMDGAVSKTEIDTDGVSTENLTVRNEMRLGNFVWRSHGNGNLGLVYEGSE